MRVPEQPLLAQRFYVYPIFLFWFYCCWNYGFKFFTNITLGFIKLSIDRLSKICQSAILISPCLLLCFVLFGATTASFVRMLYKFFMTSWLQFGNAFSLNAAMCVALQWRHNERHGTSNHQPYDFYSTAFWKPRSKKTPKLRANGLCAGKSPVTGEFPSQRANNAEMFPFDGVIMGNPSISIRLRSEMVSNAELQNCFVRLNKLLKKQSSFQWLDAPWRW